jgi:hypothetical protein
MGEEPRSLWEELDSAVEPWRRGRAVLVTIGCGYFVVQALFIALQIAIGNIEQLLAFSIGCVIFWLQFYFIWIGVHWIRWLVGAWAGVLGFYWLLWGFHDGNVVMACFGAANVLIASYFCLAPSVYFFAKRQREKRDWKRSFSMAAVFVLVFLTLFLGGVGFQAYKLQLETEAREFGDMVFAHTFSDHDLYFCIGQMTEQALAASGGRNQMTQFLKYTLEQAGDVHDIHRTASHLAISYLFPTRIRCAGVVLAEGSGLRGPVQLHLAVTKEHEGWRIENISWHYRGQR